MNELYEPQPCYPKVPQTIGQVVQEFLNPTEKKPFFKGYEPHNYFKRVSPFRSDTKHEWEPK